MIAAIGVAIISNDIFQVYISRIKFIKVNVAISRINGLNPAISKSKNTTQQQKAHLKVG